jgi:hypothetical protein
MRQTLATIATIGLLITGLTSLTGPADAAPAPETRGEQPVRDLHDEMVKKRGKIFFQGRVDPGSGPVIVQKKACSYSKCPWKRYKKVDTHGPQERWKVRVYAPRNGSWFWRGYVKASDGYATSWTGKWRTYVL